MTTTTQEAVAFFAAKLRQRSFRLASENEDERRERRQVEREQSADMLEALAAERGALSAEVERLRRGLQSIADNTCCEGCQEASRVAQGVLK
jgi:hypothetical protein